MFITVTCNLSYIILFYTFYSCVVSLEKKKRNININNNLAILPSYNIVYMIYNCHKLYSTISLIIHSLNSYRKLLKRPKDLLINASHVLRQSILADVIPNNCLGNKSNVFYYNNKNNQLKRQVWPFWRCFLDAQLWT